MTKMATKQINFKLRVKQFKFFEIIYYLLHFWRPGRFGHFSYSQKCEDVFIEKLLSEFALKKEQMCYLDIGAFHPIIYSNTFKLHKKGWKGISVDLSEETEKAFENIRPGARFLRIPIGGNTCLRQASVSKKGMSELNSLSPDIGDYIKNFDSDFVQKQVEVVGIKDFFIENNIEASEITFLNIDIEGLDSEVLANYPFDLSKPLVIATESYQGSIEQHLSSSSHNLLKNMGYSLIYWIKNTAIYRLESD